MVGIIIDARPSAPLGSGRAVQEMRTLPLGIGRAAFAQTGEFVA